MSRGTVNILNFNFTKKNIYTTRADIQQMSGSDDSNG